MSEAQAIHTHCATCVKMYCAEKINLPDSCEMADCHLSCGARFHSCKENEHSRCCSNETVPCINSTYGCPHTMLRSQCGQHLRVCPASVIQCGTEWNRWPVYSPERKARVPFAERQYHARYGQLDVAVALRDQRMLERSLKAPRSTRRALRNNLTRRFPAVPIMVKSKSRDEDEPGGDVTSGSDEDSDAPWNQAKQPPGLVASVCNELFKTKMNKMVESGINVKSQQRLSDDEDKHNCDAAANNVINTTSISDLASFDKCDENESTKNLKAPKNNSVPQPPEDIALMLQEILSLDLNMEFVTRYQAKPKSMYTFLCAQLFRRDEYPWHVKNLHNDILGSLNGWLEQRCPLAHEGCTYSFTRMHLGEDSGNTVVYNSIVESFGVRPTVAPSLISQRESSEREYATYLAATRGKEPTPEIQTSKHYQSGIEVKGNLNRQLPDRRAMSKSPGRDLRPDPLTSLPVELIHYIAGFLDGFSLCNLSLTCTALRNVCCSLLEEKGLVIQEWSVDKKSTDKKRWIVSEQRWMFSTAFSPVRTWRFCDYEHLSKHLQNCPFNKPLEKHVPVLVLPAADQSEKTTEIMKRMYPDVTFPLEQEFQFPQVPQK